MRLTVESPRTLRAMAAAQEFEALIAAWNGTGPPSDAMVAWASSFLAGWNAADELANPSQAWKADHHCARGVLGGNHFASTGQTCKIGSDCESNVCWAGSCEPPKCNDGILNGDETAWDCGGSCGPCP